MQPQITVTIPRQTFDPVGAETPARAETRGSVRAV